MNLANVERENRTPVVMLPWTVKSDFAYLRKLFNCNLRYRLFMLLYALHSDFLQVLDCFSKPNHIGNIRSTSFKFPWKVVPFCFLPMNLLYHISPRMKGGASKRRCSLPYKQPTPVGPNILREENAKKSQPSSWTSIGRWGADWAPSKITIAPSLCAIFVSFFASLIVPRTFDICVKASTFAFFILISKSSSSRIPSSSTLTISNSQPILFEICCQGTKLL